MYLLLNNTLHRIILIGNSVSNRTNSYRRRSSSNSSRYTSSNLLLTLLNHLLHLLLHHLLFNNTATYPNITLHILVLLYRDCPFPTNLLPVMMRKFTFPTTNYTIYHVVRHSGNCGPNVTITQRTTKVKVLYSIKKRQPPISTLSRARRHTH